MKFDWKLAGQWVMIAAMLIGFFWTQDRRLTMVEAGLQQEMKGYRIMFENTTKMMKDSEERLTIRLQRIEDRLNR